MPISPAVMRTHCIAASVTFWTYPEKLPCSSVMIMATTVAIRWLWLRLRNSANNIHVADGISEEAFVDMRSKRDATVPLPDLMLAALQVNIRGGRLPEPEGNSVRFFELPSTISRHHNRLIEWPRQRCFQ